MQAIGTPVLSNFHHEFSLHQLIIRETTKDSTRRSFPKCFNLKDLFSQKIGASISRHNFDPHLWQTLAYALDCIHITKLQLSRLRCLSLSSRFISFISIVLPSSSLFSFQIAQMFEILSVVKIFGNLSSETSRWNMQAIGTPTLSNFHHEFSLDQLIIRETTKDSTRRSFPKCFNLNNRHVMMSPKLHI